MLRSATQARLQRLFEVLDYSELGAIYCEEGGDAFWAAHRDPALQLGTQWAEALAARLPRDGRSLYVGAGVAELPALVMETQDLGRQVEIASLQAAECTSLNEALARAEIEGIEFVCRDAAAVEGRFDHLSLVSVLTDPELYPVSSAVGYGRLPPVLLDVEAFVAEREGLRRLAQAVLGRVAAPGWVTTSVEEVAWLLDAAPRASVALEPDDETLPTAIVGDPIGFLAVRGDG